MSLCPLPRLQSNVYLGSLRMPHLTPQSTIQISQDLLTKETAPEAAMRDLAASHFVTEGPKNPAPHVLRREKREKREEQEALVLLAYKQKKAEEAEEAAQIQRERIASERMYQELAAQRRAAVAATMAEERLRQATVLNNQRKKINRRTHNQNKLEAETQKANAELSDDLKRIRAHFRATSAASARFYENDIWNAPEITEKELKQKWRYRDDEAMNGRYFVEYLENVYRCESFLIQWSGFQLSFIPDIIGIMKNITEVNLSYNNIWQGIPQELQQLTSLRRLNLSHNKIEEMPSLDGLASTLETLDLSFNRLIRLEDISSLTRLETLDLEHNLLRSLPPGIEHCTRMAHLNVRSNQIRLVAPELGLLLDHNLSFLSLRNNPVFNIPPVVFLQGTRSTLTYLLKSSGLMLDEEEGAIRNDFLPLLRDPFLADVELQCNDKSGPVSFKAHACILRARSPRFKQMLSGVEATPETPFVLNMPNNSETTKMLIDYIYTDKFEAPAIDLIPLALAQVDLVQIEKHNRLAKESFVSLLSAYAILANSFALPHLWRLIEEVRSKYATIIFPINSNATKGLNDPMDATSSFKADMQALRQGEHSPFDVSFVHTVSNEVVYAHKILLCSRSPALKALLTGGMIESTQTKIPVTDDTQWLLQKAVVEFCYTDDVEDLQVFEEQGGITQLLFKAQEMQLPRLQSILESVVGYSLDRFNVCGLFQMAYECKLPKLERAAEYYIFTHWYEVSSSKECRELPQALQMHLDEAYSRYGQEPAPLP